MHPPLFVSLGSHCEVVSHLRSNGLRKAGMPFDWLLSSHHAGFIAALRDDFLYFTDERFLLRGLKSPTILENVLYKIEFRHDWPCGDNWVDLARSEEQLQVFKSKYARRIERFKNLDSYEGKVFFIRAAFDFDLDSFYFWSEPGIEKITSVQAKEIGIALKHYFPKLNFTLVIVNYAEEKSDPIDHLEGICEFKVRKSNKPEDYLALFNLLSSL